MPFPSTAPADLIAALAEALAAAGARWYLFGAQAALIWGRPRLTAHVDVTVRLDPEDLIVTKILAGRPKDVEDVRGILFERLPQLDLTAIRSTLGLLEAALSQSDLQPAFEAELARAQR